MLKYTHILPALLFLIYFSVYVLSEINYKKNFAFNTFITLATKPGQLNAHMASDYKYFSLSEGMGAKIAGSTTAMRMLKDANENGRNANELVSDKEIESIDYYLNKGKLEGAVIEDETGQMDALKLTEARLDALAVAEPNLKSAIEYTLKKIKFYGGSCIIT